MTTRRNVLAGLLATGVSPVTGWADVGAPRFLAAGRAADGQHHLFGLSASGAPQFAIPLPSRGHAAAAHPTRCEAVAFARRPGLFAIVMECRNGDVIAKLHAPEGRHFYGHGVFSSDGRTLFTTENDFEGGQGRIGVWDAAHGYRRIGEFSSGGVGPHDLRLMPDGATLVVANGGIETHPDTGRAKLNLPFMQSNLSYLTLDGAQIEQVSLGADHQLNSIRHLALRDDGQVAFAMQWQGDLTQDRPLLGLHRRGSDAALLGTGREMQGYAGSVSYFADGSRVATSSPRGGRVQVFDTRTQQTVTSLAVPDACGLAQARSALMITTGTGAILSFATDTRVLQTSDQVAWDNHLIALL